MQRLFKTPGARLIHTKEIQGGTATQRKILRRVTQPNLSAHSHQKKRPDTRAAHAVQRGTIVFEGV